MKIIKWNQAGESNYEYQIWDLSRKIFPENKDGKRIPINLVTFRLTLRHKISGSSTFHKYLHQKKWYWRDSRNEKNCPRREVVKEDSTVCGFDSHPCLYFQFVGTIAQRLE